jgi:Ca2+-binding EF-hand superfamily protein
MTKYLLLAATAIALASPSFAQQGGGRTPPTPEERKANFVKADANKDGKLNKDEFKASLGERAAQMGDRIDQFFAGRDADKDGSISEAEYLAPMQRPGGN